MFCAIHLAQMAHFLEMNHAISCPSKNAEAMLSGTILVNGDTGLLASEHCNLRKRELTLGKDCDRGCGLGTSKSPLRAYEF